MSLLVYKSGNLSRYTSLLLHRELASSHVGFSSPFCLQLLQSETFERQLLGRGTYVPHENILGDMDDKVKIKKDRKVRLVN